MSTRRRPSDPAIKVAHLVVEALAGDEDFVAQVTTREIQRRVDAGELIPKDALHITGGLELTPTGRLAQFETAVKVLLAVLGDIADEHLTDPQRDAIAQVDVLINPQVPEPDVVDDAPVDDESDEEPVEAPPADDSATSEPVDGKSYPTGFPVDDTYACSTCDTEIPEDQALVSWTRFRVLLCPPCLSTH